METMINNIDNNIELLHSVVSNLGHNTRLIMIILLLILIKMVTIAIMNLYIN